MTPNDADHFDIALRIKSGGKTAALQIVRLGFG
jgi:hypothetical protein